ncbi:MAG: hypothetical protein AAF733_08025 [Verrucomicrobiota bacterium]
MKTNSLILFCFLLLGSLLGHGSLLQADENRPSLDEVLEFLRDKMPESMDLLEQVRKEEGVEEYEEVLESAGDLLEEYLEIRREEGEEIAELFLEEERNLLRIRVLAEAWHEENRRSDKEALEEALIELISAQIDRDIERGWRELDALEEEVEEFRRELTEMAENREIIIAEELEEILFDEIREEEDWDEEEQDEWEEDEDEDDDR